MQFKDYYFQKTITFSTCNKAFRLLLFNRVQCNLICQKYCISKEGFEAFERCFPLLLTEMKLYMIAISISL